MSRWCSGFSTASHLRLDGRDVCMASSIVALHDEVTWSDWTVALIWQKVLVYKDHQFRIESELPKEWLKPCGSHSSPMANHLLSPFSHPPIRLILLQRFNCSQNPCCHLSPWLQHPYTIRKVDSHISERVWCWASSSINWSCRCLLVKCMLGVEVLFFTGITVFLN